MFSCSFSSFMSHIKRQTDFIICYPSYSLSRWNHQLNGHEFDRTLGDSEGQGSLVCCTLWSCKESDTTAQLNNSNTHSSQGFSWSLSCLFLFFSPAFRYDLEGKLSLMMGYMKNVDLQLMLLFILHGDICSLKSFTLVNNNNDNVVFMGHKPPIRYSAW